MQDHAIIMPPLTEVIKKQRQIMCHVRLDVCAGLQLECKCQMWFDYIWVCEWA